MMYKKNFVAALKVGGKVLRESNDRVELPFGSEYSVLLKNLDSVRVQARIQIDGTDAVDWVVINPNSEVEIERFLRSAGSLDQGNRFKFIERTGKIESHRGVKADDGLVRIEFKREKVYEAPKVVEHHTYHHHDYRWPYVWYTNFNYTYPYYGTISTNTTQANTTVGIKSASIGSGILRSSSGASGSLMSAQNCSFSGPISNDIGITTEGSISKQRFSYVFDFPTEKSEVVVLHLVGRKAGSPVTAAKTVQTKLKCSVCGEANKSSSKFCRECGTSLEKV